MYLPLVYPLFRVAIRQTKFTYVGKIWDPKMIGLPDIIRDNGENGARIIIDMIVDSDQPETGCVLID